MPDARRSLGELFDARRLTASDAAAELHVSTSTVTRWLHGEHRKIPANAVPTLAVLLDVPETTILVAVYGVDELLARHGMPASLAELMYREAAHAGEATWLHDTTKATLIVEALAPSNERRRREMSAVSNIAQLPRWVDVFDYYIDHSVDHYVMAVLDGLRRDDPRREADVVANLWRIVDAALRNREPSASDIRLLNNALAYLIAFSPQASSDDALDKAIRIWHGKSKTRATLYIARDAFRAAGNARILRGDTMSEELVMQTAPDASVHREEFGLVAVGSEALYYAPEVGARAPQRLIPELSNTRVSTSVKILTGLLAHLTPELPRVVIADTAWAMDVFLQLQGAARIQLAMHTEPELRRRMTNLATMPEPDLGAAAFQHLWRNMLARVIEVLGPDALSRSRTRS